MRKENRTTRNMRLADAAHDVIDKKLAKANIRRAKRGASYLTKGMVAEHYFEKVTIKDLEFFPSK